MAHDPADGQAALLRVAESVARGTASEEVLAVITREVGVLSGASQVRASTVDSSGVRKSVASWPEADVDVRDPEACRWGIPIRLVDAEIRAELVLRLPHGRALPNPIEGLLGEFLELASLSIVNADARRALSSSRARLLHAGDEERRLIEQALYEGPRRRLRRVSTELRLVQQQLSSDAPRAGALLMTARDTLGAAMSELQLVARGIHPVLLTERGLDTALADLVSESHPRATLRSSIGRRVASAVELGAYYIVAGTLNDVVARGRDPHTVVEVRLDGSTLAIDVCDDGGTPVVYGDQTLLMLRDRAAALGGELHVQHGAGSRIAVRARLPVSEASEPAPVNPEDTVDGDAKRSSVAPADQTTALLRVATLVAHNPGSSEVFEAIARELGRALGALTTNIIRFDPDGMLTIQSGWNLPGHVRFADGGRFPVTGSHGTTLLIERQAAVSIDKVDAARTLVPEVVARMKTDAAGYLPLFVRGRLWGEVLATATDPPVLRPDLDGFIAKLLELVAISIDNAQTEADLWASRSRVVEASDGARRRIERDLHDGAQQGFVALAIKLQLVQIMIDRDSDEAPALLRDALTSLDAGLQELSQFTRGVHPSLLRDVGLVGALQNLVENSGPPVTLTCDANRPFDDAIVLAAYYVVSEALTNIARHAQAHATRVDVADRDGRLTIVVTDDGLGGACDHQGTGLAGLADRVHTLGGQFTLDSRPGHGTTISVSLPGGSQSAPGSSAGEAGPEHGFANPI